MRGIKSMFGLFLALVGFVTINASPTTETALVFVKGEGGYYCHKIPYILRTMSNVLIALAEGRGREGRDACDDWSGPDLVLKRSEDNGQTWSDLRVLYSNSTSEITNVVGNAAPVQDTTTGRIWVPFCINNEIVYITYSDDDGLTFSEPVYHPDLALSDWKWIGLGPPAGIQLQSGPHKGRLLIPSYHTSLIKGDGLISKGHTIYSDDHGANWQIGSSEFGAPFLANECQAVELADSSILINARSVTNNRIQVVSHDGGITFDAPTIADTLMQPLEGCEGSIIRHVGTDTLYFSIPYTKSVTRMNMTLFVSHDQGVHWTHFLTVDEGSVAYSAMSIDYTANTLELLYERSDNLTVVFEPQEIRYVRIAL